MPRKNLWFQNYRSVSWQGASRDAGTDVIHSFARRNSRFSTLSRSAVFKTWRYILCIWNLSLSPPNFAETPVTRIKQGGTAEAAFEVASRPVDSMIIHSKFPVADWFPGAEIAREQRYIGNKCVDLWGRDLRYLNNQSVSRQGASRYTGTDVTLKCALLSWLTLFVLLGWRAAPDSKFSIRYATRYLKRHFSCWPPFLFVLQAYLDNFIQIR